jgi:hypothetical protein
MSAPDLHRNPLHLIKRTPFSRPALEQLSGAIEQSETTPTGLALYSFV